MYNKYIKGIHLIHNYLKRKNCPYCGCGYFDRVSIPDTTNPKRMILRNKCTQCGTTYKG